MKVPFWVLKRTALKLLKGKWNPLVLSLFVPFLLYCVFAVNLSKLVEAAPSAAIAEQYVWISQYAMVFFSLLLELLTVGICSHLHENQPKATFFGIYRDSVRSIFRIFPAIVLKFLLPFGVSALLNSNLAVSFYDYLMFSLMSLETYTMILTVLIFLVDILAVYLNYSLLLAPCIAAHRKDYSGIQVVKESFSMSRGKRFYLFFLELSFLGWLLLGSLAFVIGILWALIYMIAARYAYYRSLTMEKETPQINPIV